ncbi:MAG: galactokinase, partial [Defluviitaleaceae bacterium]|nr:galactokinase [Defluviitaleaceae bacterium]
MDLQQIFIQHFGQGDTPTAFFIPGRVNIIGEHIDYNGGYVLPCMLAVGTHALIRRRVGSAIRFASTNVQKVISASLEKVTYSVTNDWANYPLGVVAMMQKDGHALGGFDVLFSGNIPRGAGLSSSASIEMAMAVALNAAFSLNYEPITLVKLTQKSENQFCGVNCGIMDQFAVGMGKDGFAIYLNCGTLDYRLIPMQLGEYALLVVNTNKPRRLADSKYNERRAECESALALLQSAPSAAHIKQLADLSPEEFSALAHLIPNPIVAKRVRHVVHENDRVKQAVQALEANDLPALGALLNASHASLRDDYEVTGIELDTLAAAAQK